MSSLSFVTAYGEYQIVEMQDPNQWIMPAVQVPDDFPPDVVPVMRRQLNPFHDTLQPVVFARVPLALVYQQGRMLLVQQHGAVPRKEVRYTLEYKSSHMHTASTIMLVQTPAVGGVGVQRSVEFHSYKTLA